MNELVFEGLNHELNLTNKEKQAFFRDVHLHILIGVFERMPRPQDDLFPTRLPIGMPQFYVDYYYKQVCVGPKAIAQIYLSVDQLITDRPANPRKNRICGHSCYELSTYVNNTDANWNFKLNLTHNETFSGRTLNTFGNRNDFRALNELHAMTQCLPLVGGMIVNPHAPYTAFAPNAIAFCSGQPWLVIIKTPFMQNNMSADHMIKHILYVKRGKDDSLALRKRTKQYGEVQLGLGVMYLKNCFFGIYLSRIRKLVLIKVAFDKEFFEKMLMHTYSTYFSKLMPRLANSAY